MDRQGKHTTMGVASLGLLSMLLFSGCTEYQASRLEGRWQGHYLCPQGITGLTLDIKKLENNRLVAIFHFYPTEMNVLAAEGAYIMVGEVKGDGSFAFFPQEWISRPPNYEMVGLMGKLEWLSDKASGIVAAPPCKGFVIEKVGGVEDTVFNQIQP